MSVILRKWFSSLMVPPVNSNSASSSRASHCSTETVWNFFATSHGNGPVDGIGGSTTRLVSEVMSGKAEVTTSTEFAEVAAKKCQNIQIKHICKGEVQSEIKNLDDDWNEITAIPNTK